MHINLQPLVSGIQMKKPRLTVAQASLTNAPGQSPGVLIHQGQRWGPGVWSEGQLASGPPGGIHGQSMCGWSLIRPAVLSLCSLQGCPGVVSIPSHTSAAKEPERTLLSGDPLPGTRRAWGHQSTAAPSAQPEPGTKQCSHNTEV